MESFDFDACVVGAGAVGLASAYSLAKAGLSTVVLENESAIGQGVSSRNSEVVHAGLYYPSGSLKARLCVAGRRSLYGFLDAHGIDYRKCGKLVVASEPDQVPRIEAIERQAVANGVEGLSMVSGASTMAMEPGLRAVGALVSSESGLFDSHGYMLALRGEIEDRGGAIAMATPFLHAAPRDRGGFDIHAGGDSPTHFTAGRLVTAPGLGAQAVAARIEGFALALIPKLHYGKGVYFRLNGPAPFEHLIYPPPIPGALGVHYRKDLGGQAVFGPDLAFVDVEDYSVETERVAGFYSYIRRFWPGLPDGALSPDYAGLRPKIHGPGEAQPDFRIDGPALHGLDGLVVLFGIESPGLTASLAIGDYVRTLLEGPDRG